MRLSPTILLDECHTVGKYEYSALYRRLRPHSRRSAFSLVRLPNNVKTPPTKSLAAKCITVVALRPIPKMSFLRQKESRVLPLQQNVFEAPWTGVARTPNVCHFVKQLYREAPLFRILSHIVLRLFGHHLAPRTLFPPTVTIS